MARKGCTIVVAHEIDTRETNKINKSPTVHNSSLAPPNKRFIIIYYIKPRPATKAHYLQTLKTDVSRKQRKLKRGNKK